MEIKTNWATIQWGFEKDEDGASWSGKDVWLCHDKLREHFDFDYNEHTRVRLVMSPLESPGALDIQGVCQNSTELILRDDRFIWVDPTVGEFAERGMELCCNWMRLEVE